MPVHGASEEVHITMKPNDNSHDCAPALEFENDDVEVEYFESRQRKITKHGA